MRRRQKHSVNLAPLIDVVFILLAFLLVYSRMDTTQSIQVDLPILTGEVSSEKSPVIISIDSEGSIYLGADLLDKEDLRLKISEMSKSANIQIKADKNAKSENLIIVMQILSEQGIESTEILITEN